MKGARSLPPERGLHTGRRSKKAKVANSVGVAAEAKLPAPAAPAQRRDLPRQILLAAVTALVVARPLVLGEDPGLLDRPLSEPMGLQLGMLWLAVAVGWAAWRMWSQQGTWQASLVDAALLVVTGLLFVSASVAARYKHPAWLIAWEWIILLVVFYLVRHLAATPEDRRCLLAALLATGVSLSVLALYQYAVVLPHFQSLANNQPELHKLLAAKYGVFLEPNDNQEASDPQELYWKQRLLMNHVYATYAHPNAFAGFLALLIPAGVGWTFVTWRRYPGTGWPFRVGGCVLLLAVALFLTHSRGALLATLLVGGAVATIRYRHYLLAHRRQVLGIAAGLAVFVVLASWGLREREGITRLAQESMQKRFEYWGGTWRMMVDSAHPGRSWLGVGPGNFGRLYPRYMAADAMEKVKDPHNFALEIWASAGIFALVAMLVALAVFFWRTRAAWTATDPEPGAEIAPGPPRWEFYVGAMIGLVLSFVLRVIGSPPQEILVEGAVSGVCSLIWFAAFALFESLPWPGPTQALALVAGVAACLLNLCVSGGMFYPSVAQPLWIVAALALAPITTARSSRGWLVVALPLPIAAVACWFYFSTVFLPAISSNSHLSDAKIGEEHWFKTVKPALALDMAQSRTPDDKLRATNRANLKLESLILKPLQEAVRADPADSYPRVQLAHWYGEQWILYARLNQFESPNLHFSIRSEQRKFGERALKEIDQVWKDDPDGLEAYSVAYQLYNQFAQVPGFTESERARQLAQAAQVARLMLERDPTDAQLHYALAGLLFQLKDDIAARRQARLAEERDQLLSSRVLFWQDGKPQYARGLTDKERKDVAGWLASAPTP